MLLSRGSIKTFAQQRSKFTLPDLPYDYNALEPVISAEIMQLHHSKHHATYVNNLNATLEQLDEAESKQDIERMLKLHSSLKFNHGGHVNHSIFWNNLCPVKQAHGEPTGKLHDAINQDFGSFSAFQTEMNAKTTAIQGSGWGWLAFDPHQKKLQIITTNNQDPVSMMGLVPLLGIDVWEHAYYLQYRNVRADYVKAMWKIINWSDVSKRFTQQN